MDKYRKLIVAGVGLVLIIARQFFDFQVDEKNADAIIDAVLMALTLAGIYAVPQTPPVEVVKEIRKEQREELKK